MPGDCQQANIDPTTAETLTNIDMGFASLKDRGKSSELGRTAAINLLDRVDAFLQTHSYACCAEKRTE